MPGKAEKQNIMVKVWRSVFNDNSAFGNCGYKETQNVKTTNRVKALVIDKCQFSRKGFEYLLSSCGYKTAALEQVPTMSELYKSGWLLDFNLLMVRLSPHPSLYFAELMELALFLNSHSACCRIMIISGLEAESCYNSLLSFGINSENIKRITVVDARLTVMTLQKIISGIGKSKSRLRLFETHGLFYI